jgi:Ca-activated chloride channel family protein
MNDATLLTTIVDNFHFLRPLWLLAIIPTVLFIAVLWRLNEKSSAWDRAIDHDLLPFLLDTTKSVAERTPLILLLTLWLVSIVALAGPVWEKIAQPVQARQDALVIVYDQSLSMYATDYDPNRQVISKRKVLDVLDRRVEGQTGLVVYAGDAHAVTPLTEDTVTIKSLVPSINPNMMPAFGSNTLAAIETAKDLFADAGALTGTLLLVTDGVERRDFGAIANLLSNTGFRLAILGVGTAQGAPIPAAGGDFLRQASGQIVTPILDSAALEDLADMVDGRYSDMQISSADLDYLLNEDAFFDQDELTDVDENFDIWYEVGPWLLLLALPLSAMIFRRGWILSISVLLGGVSLLTPSAPAQAAEWEDLWKTKNQQGAEAFDSEDPISAVGLFKDQNWKGAAAYRAGDFAGAIQAYSIDPGTDADAHYNLGNALAMSQAFEQAIGSYNIAIALEPDHEDAIHNRDIVQELLEEQQQEQEEQEENEQSEQQEESEEEEPEEGESSEEEEEQEQGEQDPSEEENEEEMERDESEQEGGSEQEQSEEEQSGETPNQSNAEQESQESLEQWLRRIDDDPGELLQRKFQFEYRRRQLESRNNSQPTETQIW